MRIVSVPNVDAGALPLRLPVADGINNGGFVVPGPGGRTQQAYSNIDLLVAGIEAIRTEDTIYHLAKYFDVCRNGMYSENEVYIYYTVGDSFHVKSVAQIKHDLRINRNETILRVLQKNAPLTFKWGIR